VAVLTRKVGVQHIEQVEDSVQSALMAALTAWTAHGQPEDPGAWLYAVAKNQLLNGLRRETGHTRILGVVAKTATAEGDPSASPYFAGEVRDDLLRMLFICCSDAIPRESRLVFALKTLCGFSTAEIALRLFTTSANVHKRLQRARDRLREDAAELETPPLQALGSRLPSVHEVLYLLFNEGYLSAHAEHAIRRELCDEAVRLASLLAEHAIGAKPETFALLALMHLHAARLSARDDGKGGLLLLEEQDRTLFDSERIRLGLQWLAQAATGDVFSRYHAEAGIAAEHCLAPSFRATRWQQIVELYSMLERVAPSPLHTLNKAVAVAEWQGATAGLSVVDGFVPPSWLTESYLWDAVLSDLHRRAGHTELAQRHQRRAIASAPTNAVRDLLRRRLVVSVPS
jgi:RNA polymerase sigma factor (sigma-70 family)